MNVMVYWWLILLLSLWVQVVIIGMLSTARKTSLLFLVLRRVWKSCDPIIFTYHCRFIYWSDLNLIYSDLSSILIIFRWLHYSGIRSQLQRCYQFLKPSSLVIANIIPCGYISVIIKRCGTYALGTFALLLWWSFNWRNR